MENNNQKNEQLLLDMVKELEKKNKTVWSSMWAILIVSMTALIAGIFVAGFFIPEGVWQLITVLGLCVLFLFDSFSVSPFTQTIPLFPSKIYIPLVWLNNISYWLCDFSHSTNSLRVQRRTALLSLTWPKKNWGFPLICSPLLSEDRRLIPVRKELSS
ncbi:MAG: hypothetical protein E7445_09890 [Ruminococcaceae bacterium]|nr:hypothetical protein [Oscillospiraceae bacterium]